MAASHPPPPPPRAAVVSASSGQLSPFLIMCRSGALNQQARSVYAGVDTLYTMNVYMSQA